jgi:hypothetical protein
VMSGSVAALIRVSPIGPTVRPPGAIPQNLPVIECAATTAM